MYYLDVKTLQDVLHYLGTCPYAQVQTLIPKLLALKKVEEEHTKEE